MGFEDLHSNARKCVNLRFCNVSGCMTELLEIHVDHPSLHVVFVPGNPGFITLYKEFVESLFELLGGTASVSAVGYARQTEKNWDHGKLYSLQEQIDHKIEFIEAQNIEVPLVLVGHSIGSYISLEMLRRLPRKAVYCIGLYPFLALNLQSKKQSTIMKIAMSRVLSTTLSFLVASLGLLPRPVLRLIFKLYFGESWSNTALEAACSHLSQYHNMRNVLFMAMIEFRKLSKTPDWVFMGENQDKIAFLYGMDDHWRPLQMFEEISKQASGIALSIENEGHTHKFCCTEAGSVWVARHVASLIKNKFTSSCRARFDHDQAEESEVSIEDKLFCDPHAAFGSLDLAFAFLNYYAQNRIGETPLSFYMVVLRNTRSAAKLSCCLKQKPESFH